MIFPFLTVQHLYVNHHHTVTLPPLAPSKSTSSSTPPLQIRSSTKLNENKYNSNNSNTAISTVLAVPTINTISIKNSQSAVVPKADHKQNYSSVTSYQFEDRKSKKSMDRVISTYDLHTSVEQLEMEKSLIDRILQSAKNFPNVYDSTQSSIMEPINQTQQHYTTAPTVIKSHSNLNSTQIPTQNPQTKIDVPTTHSPVITNQNTNSHSQNEHKKKPLTLGQIDGMGNFMLSSSTQYDIEFGAVEVKSEKKRKEEERAKIIAIKILEEVGKQGNIHLQPII